MENADLNPFKKYCYASLKFFFKVVIILEIFIGMFTFFLFFSFKPAIILINATNSIQASLAFALLLSGYLCLLVYPILYGFANLTVEQIKDTITNLNEKLNIWAKEQSEKNENPGKTCESNKTMDERDKFVYEKLLQLRDLDNKLLWTRVNILIVFQGVLLAAFVTAYKELIPQQMGLLILIACTGLFSSIASYCIAKGSSYWVKHWETLLATIEPSLFGKGIIFHNNHHASDPMFKINQKRKGYVSTRDWMLALTMMLPIIWIIIFTSFLKI